MFVFLPEALTKYTSNQFSLFSSQVTSVGAYLLPISHQALCQCEGSLDKGLHQDEEGLFLPFKSLHFYK